MAGRSTLPRTSHQQSDPEGRRRRVRKLLSHPHVLVQTMSVLSTLSAHAHAQFLQLSHGAVWSAVRGQPIGFLDGGMASLEDLGTEPLAVRVGSYMPSSRRSQSREPVRTFPSGSGAES